MNDKRKQKQQEGKIGGGKEKITRGRRKYVRGGKVNREKVDDDQKKEERKKEKHRKT